MKARIMAPTDYIGAIMKLGQDRRGIYNGMQYLEEQPGGIRLSSCRWARSCSTSTTA